MSTFTLQIRQAEGYGPDVTYHFDGVDFGTADHHLSRCLTETDSEYRDGVFNKEGEATFRRGKIEVDVLFDTPLPRVQEDPEGWVMAVAVRAKLVKDTFRREFPAKHQTYTVEV